MIIEPDFYSPCYLNFRQFDRKLLLFDKEYISVCTTRAYKQSGEKEGLKSKSYVSRLTILLLNPSKSDVIKGKMLAISCVVSFSDTYKSATL